MRIGLIGTFPPRACGLATFTADVASALRDCGQTVEVVALVDDDDDDGEAGAGAGAARPLDRGDPAAYRETAAWLNGSVDVVLIQHEFGIFGGVDGALVSELTNALDVPYVLTLHTVEGCYTATQRGALDAPLRNAAGVLVFSAQAVNVLAAQFHDVTDRCRVVPHGVPAVLYRPRSASTRRRVGLDADAVVMTTFGFLSPGKGIEQAIGAVATLRHAIPELIYIVAGRSHPEVVRRHGEVYRDELLALARRLGVDDVVVFRDWFHDVDEVADLLAASDVFVTPYTGVEQIVSGTLSFAVASGLPFVSTSYRYARELADQGCGSVVDASTPEVLAAALKEVLGDPDVASLMSGQARRVAADMSWPCVGRRIAAELTELTESATLVPDRR